jgi:hypothetical protein
MQVSEERGLRRRPEPLFLVCAMAVTQRGGRNQISAWVRCQWADRTTRGSIRTFPTDFVRGSAPARRVRARLNARADHGPAPIRDEPDHALFRQARGHGLRVMRRNLGGESVSPGSPRSARTEGGATSAIDGRAGDGKRAREDGGERRQGERPGRGPRTAGCDCGRHMRDPPGERHPSGPLPPARITHTWSPSSKKNPVR